MERIDVTGKPTTWFVQRLINCVRGKWAPEWVNDTPNWYDQMGLNALQVSIYSLLTHPDAGLPCLCVPRCRVVVAFANGTGTRST